MKVIIAGSRNFRDYDTLRRVCTEYFMELNIIEIVSGNAIGADRLGEQFAFDIRIPVKKFPADWNGYGPSAGVIRNCEMADYADILIAFWDGKSPGTKHMIKTAREKGLKVEVYHFS